MIFFSGFKYWINTQTPKQTNLHTHEPLIGFECGVFSRNSDEHTWPKSKIKLWIMVNQNLKHGVNDQWMISSWMLTCLNEGGEWNYLIGIGFRYELRWVGAAQVRCWEGELRFGKVLVMFMMDSGWLIWTERPWNLERVPMFLGMEINFAARCIWLFKLVFWVRHISLLIGKVMEWFGGKKEVVYFRKGEARNVLMIETC